MAHADKSIPFVSQALTGNGGSNGVLTVASTVGFYTGQTAILTGGTLSSLDVIVLDVLNTTTMRVGSGSIPNSKNNAPFPPRPNRTSAGVDCSAYTLAIGSMITAGIQSKPGTAEENILYFVYMPDPVAALRVITVDQTGSYVAGGGGGSSTVTVNNVLLTTTQQLGSASFQYAYVTAGSITSATSSATAYLALTLSRDTKSFQILNSLNNDVSLYFNGVETYRLEAGNGFVADYASDQMKLNSGLTIGIVQNSSVTPVSGTLRLTSGG